MASTIKILLLLVSALAASVSAYGIVAPYPRLPRVLTKRQTFNDTVAGYIKQVNTIIFANGVIRDGRAIAECNSIYADAFAAMGYDPDLAEALICNAAQGGDNFPGYTIDQASAGLMIVLDGLILARDNPNTPARRLDCDNVNGAFLVDAELDLRMIIDIICYPQNFTSTSTTLSGTGTGVVSLTSTPSSTSATTTSGNVTTTSMSATITATNSTITSSSTATGNSTTSMTSSTMTSANVTTTSSTSSANSTDFTTSSTASITGTNSTTSSSTASVTGSNSTMSSTSSITGTGTGTPGCLWQMATASGGMLTCFTDEPTTFHTPTLGPTPYGYF